MCFICRTCLGQTNSCVHLPTHAGVAVLVEAAPAEDPGDVREARALPAPSVRVVRHFVGADAGVELAVSDLFCNRMRHDLLTDKNTHEHIPTTEKSERCEIRYLIAREHGPRPDARSQAKKSAGRASGRRRGKLHLSSGPQASLVPNFREGLSRAAAFFKITPGISNRALGLFLSRLRAEHVFLANFRNVIRDSFES